MLRNCYFSPNQMLVKFVVGKAIIIGSATANFHSSYLKRKPLVMKIYSGVYLLSSFITRSLQEK